MSLKLSLNNDDILSSLHGKSKSSLINMNSVSDRGSIPDKSSSLSISYKRISSSNVDYWSKNNNNIDFLDNESLGDDLQNDDGDDTDQETVIGDNEGEDDRDGNQFSVHQSAFVVSDWLARCEGSSRNYSDQWDVGLPKTGDKSNFIMHQYGGDTTGNTTDRTSLSSSDWGDDICEFDRQESQRVRHMFDEIERMLFDDHNSDAIISHTKTSAPVGFLLAPAMSKDISAVIPQQKHNLKTVVRAPGQHLEKECQQWVGRFPHFRLTGVQILPSQETGYSQHSPSVRPSLIENSSPLAQLSPTTKSGRSSVASKSKPSIDEPIPSYKTSESPRSIAAANDFDSISVRGSSIVPTPRIDHDQASTNGGVLLTDPSYEEILMSDGEYQEIIAVDFKLPEEDYRSDKGHFKRRIRGYPPLSPHAALRDTILSNVFDSVWLETISWTCPLIKKSRQRSLQTVDILPTDSALPVSVVRPSSSLSRTSTNIPSNAPILGDILQISPKTLQHRDVNKFISTNESLDPADPTSLNSFATASTGSFSSPTGRSSPTKSVSNTPSRGRTPTSLHPPSQQHSPVRSAVSVVRPSSQNSVTRPAIIEQRPFSPTRPTSSILLRSNPPNSQLRLSSVKTGETGGMAAKRLARPISVALGSRAVIHEKFRASEPDRITHFEQPANNPINNAMTNSINRARNLQPYYPHYSSRPDSGGIDTVTSKLASLPPISGLRAGRVGSAVPHYYKINQSAALSPTGIADSIKRPATTQSIRGDGSVLRRSSTPVGLRSNGNLGVHGSSIISMNPGLRSSASSPVPPEEKTKKNVGNNNWGIYPTPQPFMTPFRRAKQSNSYFR